MSTELDFEEWLPILDFETLYSISSHGRVRNDRSRRILRPSITDNGYLRVNLCKNGIRKLQRIHRLCAVAFIDNPDNKPCVDHINGVRTDNIIENLRWATVRENGQNTTISRANKSGVKGVCWDKKKWRAQIYNETGRNIHLGYFHLIRDAETAVNDARKRMHGEYASTRNRRDDNQSIESDVDLSK